MPALRRLIERGTRGDLTTLYPVLSPMLWTSIATGKRPEKHGIFGFTEPDPDGASVRAITNLSRQTKAIWNILSQEGKRSNVVGWWPSHPAEPIRGTMVSNRYQRSAAGKTDGEMARGTVYPKRLVEELASLRFHPDEVTDEIVLPFVPRGAEIDQKSDARLRSFAQIFADCTTIHSAATFLMETEEWDFTAVYYDAIDHFSHGFMRYHPPRQTGISENDFGFYHGVVEGAYRYHDMMLDRLLNLAGNETTVILMSDHGFHPDHLRPSWIPTDPAGPAVEHREHGIFVASGPGIRKGHVVTGAGVLDVMPTVLALFGKPCGEDLDGKVIGDIFEEKPPEDSVSSWDDIPGDDGCHPPGTELVREDEIEALNQLADLGYIERTSPSSKLDVLRSRRELDFNRAVALMHAGCHGVALPILESLYRDWPGEYRIGLRLALCYQATGEFQALEILVRGIKERRLHEAGEARTELKKIKAIVAVRSEKCKILTLSELFSNSVLRQIEHWESLAAINGRDLDYLEGLVALVDHRAAEAERIFSQLVAEFPQWVRIHVQHGQSLLKLGRVTDALAAFEKARTLNGHDSFAFLGLARSYLALRDFPAAREAAQCAIDLAANYPVAHFLLGQVEMREGRWGEAIAKYQRALAKHPNFPQAHQRLSFLYRRILNDPGKAIPHDQMRRDLLPGSRAKKDLREVPVPPLSGRGEDVLPTRPNVKTKEPNEVCGEAITIVTGLPRSGTSRLMQMLAAGGLSVSHDEQRVADESNPRGYFEDERSLRIREDSSWIWDLGSGIRAGTLSRSSLPSFRIFPKVRTIALS